MRATLALALVSIVIGGCGPSQRGSADQRDLADFECNERRVEYMVVGGFVASEAGVIVECQNDDPRLTKWRLDGSERVETTHRLGAAQFEALWSKVDSTGWRYLDEECSNPSAQDGDPAYTIDIADHATQKALLCSGKELPFPYDRLINELDLRAAGFGDADDAPS